MKTSSNKIAAITDMYDFLQEEGAILVDIRNASDFEYHHFPHAKHIDLMAQHFVEFFSDLQRDTPVLVYCTDGSRSKIAVRILGEMNFTTLAEIEGGINSLEGFRQNQK